MIRYASNQFETEFPKWISDNIQAMDKFGFITGKTVTFFRNRNQSGPLSQLVNSQSQSQSTTVNTREAMQVSPPEKQLSSLAFNNDNSQTSPFLMRNNFTNFNSEPSQMHTRAMQEEVLPALLKSDKPPSARRFYPVEEDNGPPAENQSSGLIFNNDNSQANNKFGSGMNFNNFNSKQTIPMNAMQEEVSPAALMGNKQALEDPQYTMIKESSSRNELYNQGYQNKKLKHNEDKQKENKSVPFWSFQNHGFPASEASNSRNINIGSMNFKIDQNSSNFLMKRKDLKKQGFIDG